MSDVRPPVIAIERRAPTPDVCPTCRRENVPPGKVPVSGLELLRLLRTVSDMALRHGIRLRLGPGITVDVMAVHSGGGGIDGFWCELEGGAMHFDFGDEATGS